MPLPERLLLDGDAVPGGGEDVAAADGHQLAALVAAGHVVEYGRVVNEGVEFANVRREGGGKTEGDGLQLIGT